jgi:hypothetical protein
LQDGGVAPHHAQHFLRQPVYPVAFAFGFHPATDMAVEAEQAEQGEQHHAGNQPQLQQPGLGHRAFYRAGGNHQPGAGQFQFFRHTAAQAVLGIGGNGFAVAGLQFQLVFFAEPGRWQPSDHIVGIEHGHQHAVELAVLVQRYVQFVAPAAVAALKRRAVGKAPVLLGQLEGVPRLDAGAGASGPSS